VIRDRSADPALTTIGVHVSAATSVWARAVTCHRVTVLRAGQLVLPRPPVCGVQGRFVGVRARTGGAR
jgi:hypothetical protein